MASAIWVNDANEAKSPIDWVIGISVGVPLVAGVIWGVMLTVQCAFASLFN